MTTLKHASKFTRCAKWASRMAGKPATFVFAAAMILVWAVCGPWFGFNDSWQLVINSSSTIMTFLVVFLIQNTQNRDAEARHVKLDERIRAAKDARNTRPDLEELEDDDLDLIRESYENLAGKSRAELRRLTRNGKP